MAGKDRQSPQGNAQWSGRGVGEDPTTTPGQYPREIFGMPVPQTSGAHGSPPGGPEPESINQAGQYPDSDPFTGVPYPQAGSGNMQPPGSAGRSPADQSNTAPARVSPPGLFYASTEADHDQESIPGRPDGMYPPTKNTQGVASPSSTGAGSGSVQGPGHPNARR